jgi:hypothetical protein
MITDMITALGTGSRSRTSGRGDRGRRPVAIRTIITLRATPSTACSAGDTPMFSRRRRRPPHPPRVTYYCANVIERQALISGLRELAGFLESNPDVPAPAHADFPPVGYRAVAVPADENKGQRGDLREFHSMYLCSNCVRTRAAWVISVMRLGLAVTCWRADHRWVSRANPRSPRQRS